jgi:hypothetical protein
MRPASDTNIHHVDGAGEALCRHLALETAYHCNVCNVACGFHVFVFRTPIAILVIAVEATLRPGVRIKPTIKGDVPLGADWSACPCAVHAAVSVILVDWAARLAEEFVAAAPAKRAVVLEPAFRTKHLSTLFS